MHRHHILLFLCAIFYTIPPNISNKADLLFKSIQQLVGKKALDDFRDSPSVRVVYYFKKDVPRLRFFFKELDKSAEYLDLYGVKFAVFDCTATGKAVIADCLKSKVERNIYTYRYGQSLLSLELETMFDVNSIMSNILQLVLLRQVPIIQTADEVSTFLQKNKGKSDTIFGYMTAIGTFDHRVFMEVAYAYQDKFRFAICTDRKGISLFEGLQPRKDRSVFWWIWTKEMADDNFDYHNVQYRDDLTLAAFAKFVMAISLPKMFDIPADGLEDPYAQVDLNSVHLYYNAATKQEVLEKANLVARHFLGSLTIILHDMDQEENKGVLPEGYSIPALSINSRKAGESFFMKMSLTTDNIATFLEDAMSRETSESTDSDRVYDSTSQDQDNDEALKIPPDMDIEAVETQDDQVAEAVFQTRSIKMPLDFVPALTDKTFPTTLKSADTVVVTFYFPFDALSMAFLRMYGEAADKLGPGAGIGLGRVNCFDWTDVCALQNISIFPTTRVFSDGKKSWDYKGPMDTQELYSTLKILELSPPVHLANKQDVMDYLTGSTNVASTVTNITVVGLFDEKHKHERNLFIKAAGENRERIVFADTDIPDSANIASEMGTSLPSIILAKYDDTIQPHVVFTGEFTVENINQFVQDNKLPKLANLTPLMFPELRARGHDFLILFTDNSPKCQIAEDSLREIVQAGQFNNISFTSMPVPNLSSVGFKVLHQYTVDPTLPYISYVNLKKGEVFNFDRSDFHKNAVSKWIVSVVSRSLEPSTVLTAGEWKPANKGYEFLRIIDWQKKEAQSKALEGQKKGRFNKETVSESMESDPEERTELDVDEIDADARNDLFELHSSRLYHHHSLDREKMGKHGEKDEMKAQGQTVKHEHTEL